MLRPRLFVCLSFCAAPVLGAQTTAHEIGRYLDRAEAFGFSGVVLLARHDSVLIHDSYGMASERERRANTTATAFDIASLAKPFTATAVLQLAQAGKLRLTDSLGLYFSDLPADKRAITLHQLLSHTSGLSRANAVTADQPSPEARVSRDTALARVWRTKLRFAPGSSWSYSNSGYVVLAAVVEIASGESFSSYLKNKVFTPAGLRETSFWGDPHSGQSMARPHDDAGEIDAPMNLPKQNWAIRGAGGIYSTAMDLLRWHQALSNGTLLNEEFASKLFEVVKNEYAYGWFVQRREASRRIIHHGGDYSGLGAQLSWFPDDSVVLIVLSNIRHEANEYPTRLVVDQVVPKIVFGESYDSLPAVRRAALAVEQERLVGTYHLPSGGRLMIGKLDGGLVIGAVGQDATDLLVPGDSLQYRAALTKRTEQLLNAIAREHPVSTITGILAQSDDPQYVKDQLVAEVAGLVPPGLHLDSAVALGTIPAATPTGAFWTVSRLWFGNTVVPYRIRWYRDVVGSYHKSSSELAALAPLRPTETGRWATWNLAMKSGVTMSLEQQSGRPDALVVLSNGMELRLEREPQRLTSSHK